MLRNQSCLSPLQAAAAARPAIPDFRCACAAGRLAKQCGEATDAQMPDSIGDTEGQPNADLSNGHGDQSVLQRCNEIATSR